MKPHLFHPEASQEYTKAAEYYARIAPELGGRFYDEIERLIREVCQEPKRFLCFQPPARRALTREFPYAVVYLEQPERIWIVAVMHAKQRPGYWQHRLG